MSIDEFHRWLKDPHRRPLVMGILNVTPDSFSDGGRFLDPQAAVAHGREVAAAGASIIDIGGESTRPGADPVEPAEQIRRVIPVIRGLQGQVDAVLSIDTSRAEVAEAALDAGAALINDVFAGRDDPELLPLAAKRGAAIVLMHMQGRPKTMQLNPTYGDVTSEVIASLRERIDAAISGGIDPGKVLIDPGIGFGKRIEHNLQLLRDLREFKTLGHPVVIGVSRKAFIGTVTGEQAASGRPFGTAAAIAWSVANGADIVRVHDAGPMSQVLRMIEAIQTGKAGDFPAQQ